MSEVQLTSSLRCDLLKRRSSEIWEVKTSSYAKEPKSNWDWISIHQKHPHQTIMRFGEQ